METKYKSAKVAAEWWAKQLSSPTKQDAGYEGEMGDMFALLMMLSESRKTKTDPKKIEKFEGLLEEEINRQLSRGGSVFLSVDYDPDWTLGKCAQEAEITGGFPVKTSMSVTREKVEVSHGYRAPTEVLYNEKLPNSDGGRV